MANIFVVEVNRWNLTKLVEPPFVYWKLNRFEALPLAVSVIANWNAVATPEVFHVPDRSTILVVFDPVRE